MRQSSQAAELAPAQHPCCLLLLQITAHFEGLPGKRLPIKGESAEYSLEVVKYDKGSKSESTLLLVLLLHVLKQFACSKTPAGPAAVWLLQCLVLRHGMPCSTTQWETMLSEHADMQFLLNTVMSWH